MKRSTRDDLLIQVLRSVRNADTYAAKYNLGSLGESLVTEYKDLDKKQVAKELEMINEGNN